MDVVDARLTSALKRQFARRQIVLSRGARRVGWKLGMGDAERIGEGPVVGYLTSATELEPGGVFGVDEVRLHVDVELAVVFAHDVAVDGDVGAAIGGWAAALELVDLGQGGDDPEEIVAANVFHRVFAVGALSPSPPPAGVLGQLRVNHKIRRSAPVDSVEDRLRAAVGILASVGESLRAGDYVITGSIVQEPVHPGDLVEADLGPLGSLALHLA